jgi:hypothetical protein
MEGRNAHILISPVKVQEQKKPSEKPAAKPAAPDAVN